MQHRPFDFDTDQEELGEIRNLLTRSPNITLTSAFGSQGWMDIRMRLNDTAKTLRVRVEHVTDD